MYVAEHRVHGWGAENRTLPAIAMCPMAKRRGHRRIESGVSVNAPSAVVLSGPSVTCGAACSPRGGDGAESRDRTSCAQMSWG